MIERGSRSRWVKWPLKGWRGTVCALLVLSVASDPISVCAQPHAKLQGVFNAVSKMPLRSAPVARAWNTAPQAPVGIADPARSESQQNGLMPSTNSPSFNGGSWLPSSSGGGAELSQGAPAPARRGGTMGNQHNGLEPSHSDPDYPSEPEENTDDVLPFLDDVTPNN